MEFAKNDRPAPGTGYIIEFALQSSLEETSTSNSELSPFSLKLVKF